MNSTPPPDQNSLSRNLAHVLDRLIQVPGSKMRIGLDPIIGLIPGVGDAISNALGSLILLEAARNKAPRILMMRMGGNVMINACVGAIPILGDIFSIWFQSNARNYALLKAWQTGEKRVPASREGKWVAAGCVVVALVLAGMCWLAIWMLSALWKWMSG